MNDTAADSQEANLTREHTPNTISESKKKSVKWPDAPILTGNDDPTFATWVQKVIKKCIKDYPDDSMDQVDYAISRTGGVVANYLEPRLAIGAEPFDTLDEVFEYIGAWMEDPDPRATARQKLCEMKQNKQEFAKFFGEWLRLLDFDGPGDGGNGASSIATSLSDESEFQGCSKCHGPGTYTRPDGEGSTEVGLGRSHQRIGLDRQ